MYCFNFFRLSLGEKERARLFDQFLLDQGSDETKLLCLTSIMEEKPS